MPEPSRINCLVASTDVMLKRAFSHEINKIAAIYGSKIPREPLDKLFEFYTQYVKRITLEHSMSVHGVAWAPILVGANVVKG